MEMRSFHAKLISIVYHFREVPRHTCIFTRLKIRLAAPNWKPELNYSRGRITVRMLNGKLTVGQANMQSNAFVVLKVEMLLEARITR